MKLNIMGKIVLGFGIVLILMFGICLYLISGIRGINTSYSTLIDQKAYGLALAETVGNDYTRSASSLKDFILDGDQDDLTNAQKFASDGDGILKEIAPLLTTDKEKQQYRDIQSKAGDFKNFSEQMVNLVSARELASGDDRTTAEKKVIGYYEANKTDMADLYNATIALSDSQSKLLDAGNKQNSAEGVKFALISTIMAVVVIILGLLMAVLVARRIATPIRLVDAEAAKIAAGDLTGKEINVKTKDEAGRLATSFNNMLTNLRVITRQLQEKSDTLASSAAELSAGAENISSSANETASTVGEVASTVEQVTANARHIAETATKAAAYANEGNEGLRNVVLQMEVIQETASTSGKVVGGLSESAGKITQIVELITSIADQTSLLALNAAIESARAGEHGRGFAVVAEEVRKLAEQSAEAAKEIYTIIASIQQESLKAVESMQQSGIQVETGAQVVREVGATIEKIISVVQGLAEEIQSVAVAAEQMNAGMQNMAASAQEQTATMEEVASTTQSLAGLAEELDVLSKRFKMS